MGTVGTGALPAAGAKALDPRLRGDAVGGVAARAGDSGVTTAECALALEVASAGSAVDPKFRS